jgi:Leucine-rich repeat (LRR) protein
MLEVAQIEKIQMLVRSKEGETVKQGLFLLSCLHIEEPIWDVFGICSSLDDVHNAVEVCFHKGFVYIWLLGKLHEFAPSWFVPMKELHLTTFPELESIPDEISLFSSLSELIIEKGKITEFPYAIQELESLESLVCSDLPLRTFPIQLCHESLGKSLKKLSFHTCSFQDIPDEIQKLSALERLDLSGMYIESFSSKIQNCVSLRAISMVFSNRSNSWFWRSNSQQVEIPTWIFNIPNLKELFLQNIRLKNEDELLSAYIEQARIVDEQISFPTKISGNYKEVLEKKMFKYLIHSTDTEIHQFFTKIDLSDFGLKELPKTLFYFSRVEEINLSKNKLSTLSPEFWSSFPKLKILDISHNMITSLPDGEFPSGLTELTLHHNRLRTLPACSAYVFGDSLNLSGNSLSSFPEEMPSLKHMKKIDISHNQFEILPHQLAICSALDKLHVGDNRLIEFPAYLADLPIRVFQSHRNLVKTLPDALHVLVPRPTFSRGKMEPTNGFSWPHTLKHEIYRIQMKKFLANATAEECKGIYKFDLSHLELECVPPVVYKISTLHNLNLSHNNITEISNEIGALSGLRVLNIRNNQISDLPSALGGLKELRELFAGDNQIQNFPTFLQDNPLLTHLNLADNQISKFPKEIWNFPKLSLCILRNNEIKEIPPPAHPFPEQWDNINLRGNPLEGYWNDIPQIRYDEVRL